MGMRVIRLLFSLCILLLLAGCAGTAMESLYQLPLQSEEHQKLQNAINEVLGTGAEYAAPTSGSSRQSIQLYDIDGDGEKEAIAFFRSSDETKPLKIYIFTQTETGLYETAVIIAEEGNAIHSIEYRDLNGDGTVEVLVGWQISADMQMLSVYQLTDFQKTELLTTDFTKYLLCDLTGSGTDTLVVFRDENSVFFADAYGFAEDGQLLVESVGLSTGVQDISRTIFGRLRGRTPAVFVESAYEDGGLITDILILTDAGLTNVTADDVGVSGGTQRSYAVYTMDINLDGIMETPVSRLLRDALDSGRSFYALEWYSFNSAGKSQLALTTYHNFSDGWYLEIPNQWVDTLALRREDVLSGERALVFSMTDGGQAEDFMTIYMLTGDNRRDRAEQGNRFILFEDDDTIYAAEITRELENGLTRQALQANFSLIVSAWE